LRAGDERAFEALVAAHHAALVRLALQYVGGAAVAEEVAQETWLAFLQSLDRFEGRASLKTWLFRILLNCARSRRRAEVRSVPFSAAWPTETDEPEPAAIERGRFLEGGVWAGHWSAPPKGLSEDGERKLLGGELRARLQAAIDQLPAAQREVIVLRDIEGLSGDEVCELLDISEANQRVLLHRARARVRSALELYLEQTGGTT
jgi:RNA polymerase sigma-70 factor (ECF subfamily)